MLSRLRRDAAPWLVRATWVLLPFTAGPALASALEPTSYAIRTLSSVALWAGWALGMVATCVALPLSLTALRVLAPAGAAAAAWAALNDQPSALAAGWTLVAAAWIFSPAFGDWCVNGPAYPNERRHLLRAPGPLVGGALGLVLTWDVVVLGLCTGPVLLAARQWVAGGVVTAVGAPLAVIFFRALHGLSRRWVVFVPAGVVLHDPITLRDPVLFPRRTLAGVLPAAPRMAPGGVDLTQRAAGVPLDLLLREPVKLILMRFGQRLGPTVETAAIRFTPTRPGAVLEEARRRRLPVP